VKRALDNREVYNEFLKVVNLFTQDIIDMATLVKEARNFLVDNELMRQFKDILGWDEKKEREVWLREQQSGGVARPVSGTVSDRRSRADKTIQYGSYRRLPASVSFRLELFQE
jgi:paired amphipathic helix protein Sin3a